MPAYFPRHTIELHLEEPAAFRRLTFSLVEMGLITGVAIRLYRSWVLTHGSNSWLYLGGTLILSLLILLGMATAHLANFPVHRWAWRAPLFAVVEATAEMATSLVLIAFGREPYGTVRAELRDWPAMAVSTLLSRGLAIVLWSLLLAGIILLVRRMLAPDIEDDADEAEGVGAG